MQIIPATNDISQIFQTVLNNQTVSIKLDYLLDSSCWLITISESDGTEIINGARIQSGFPVLFTVTPDFEGDIVPIPLTKPQQPMGRSPWGNTHQLAYLTPAELRSVGLEAL